MHLNSKEIELIFSEENDWISERKKDIIQECFPDLIDNPKLLQVIKDEKTDRRILTVLNAFHALIMKYIFSGKNLWEALRCMNKEFNLSEERYERIIHELQELIECLSCNNLSHDCINAINLSQYKEVLLDIGKQYLDCNNNNRKNSKVLCRLSNLKKIINQYKKGKLTTKVAPEEFIKNEINNHIIFYKSFLCNIEKYGRENIIISLLRYDLKTFEFKKANFISRIDFALRQKNKTAI
ncbi:MAG: hypothetical protein N2749_03635 [Clostridia bacterium]|nr:hypothetical protein [Clostridia bacterium]